MALIKCVQCKREISSRAKTCPHCGDPDPQRTEEETERERQKREDLQYAVEQTKLAQNALREVIKEQTHVPPTEEEVAERKKKIDPIRC